MATVFIPSDLVPLTGGVEKLEIAASGIRALLKDLYRQFPDLEAVVTAHKAVIIDGAFINKPVLQKLKPDSKITFLPRIGGG